MPSIDPADRRAWLDWARQRQPSLERQAWKVLHNHHDVEEIAHDVLLRVWGEDRFRVRLAQAPKPTPYLLRTARNAAIDLARRRAAQPQVLAVIDERARISVPGLSPERALEQRLLRQAFDEVHHRLTEKQRLLFLELRSWPEATRSDLINALQPCSGDIDAKRARIWAVAQPILKKFAVT